MSDVGRYRKVFVSLWLHPGFLELSDAEKIVAFYVLTGPQTNRLGIYKLSVSAAAEDLGTSSEGFAKRLRTVVATMGWLFDAKARVLYLPSWWRWNPPANANVVRGSLKDLKEIPPCALVTAFAQNLETVPETLREAFLQSLGELFLCGLPNQDQELDLNQEKKQKREKRAENGTNGNGQFATSPLDPIVREASRHFRREDDTEFKLDTIRQFLNGTQRDTPKQELLASLARVEARMA